MPTTINPLILDNPEHNKLLSALLSKTEDGECVWYGGERGYTALGQEISLTHEIYLTDREQGIPSYYVLSNDVLGSGNFAQVVSIECVLSPSAQGLIASEKNKLVAKIHNPIRCTSEEKYIATKREYDRQYHLNKRLPHIGIEPPIYLEAGEDDYVDIQAVFILKKMEGEELFEYLKRRYDGIETSSVKELLTISRVFLKNFNEQFVKNKIAHRDIKPENAYLYFDAAHDIQINIFDIGNVSQDYGTVIKKVGGTPGYMAPEARVIGTKIDDEKIDMFAVGVALQAIWGFNYKPSLSAKPNKRKQRIDDIIETFFKKDLIATTILPFIYDAIMNISHVSSERRWSIGEAIKEFDYITFMAEDALLRVTPSLSSPSPQPIDQYDERMSPAFWNQKHGLHNELKSRTTTPLSPRYGKFFAPVSPITTPGNQIKANESSIPGLQNGGNV